MDNLRTDKIRVHGYEKAYWRVLHPFFFLTPSPRILELGLGCGMPGGPGGSALTWESIFPLSNISFLEYDRKCGEKWFASIAPPSRRPGMYYGDQSSDRTLDALMKDAHWDIVVDNASHLNAHQIKTLSNLIGAVRPGGVYVVEDIHSSCRRWRANMGGSSSKEFVDGTEGCMTTRGGKPTIFNFIHELQREFASGRTVFLNGTELEGVAVFKSLAALFVAH